jgi:hypothetical protein
MRGKRNGEYDEQKLVSPCHNSEHSIDNALLVERL